MRDSVWTDILNILCLTILVDGKVYKEEVDAFLRVSRQMNNKISEGMMLTDKMLVDWFSVHKDQLAADLNANARGKFLTDHFCRVDDPKITGPLLECMLAISRSDQDFHNLEVSMVERAAKIWGWDLDSMTPS